MLQALDDLLAGVALLAGGDGILEVDEFVLYNLEQGKDLIDFDFAQQCRIWTDLAVKAVASRPASARTRPGSARSRPTSAKR